MEGISIHRRMVTMFRVANLCCAGEEKIIRDVMSKSRGVDDVRVNIVARNMTVTHCGEVCCSPVEDILEALNKKKLGASLKKNASGEGDAGDTDDTVMTVNDHARIMLTAIVTGLCVLGFVLMSSRDSVDASEGVFITSTTLGLLPVSLGCYKAALQRKLDINVLVGIAVIGSLVGAAYHEAALLITLVLAADLVEMRVMLQVRRLLAPISVDVVGDTVALKSGEEVPVKELKKGDVFLVRMGEAVACDGVVVQGTGVINESAFTGESEPVEKSMGDQCLKGTVLENGYLEVKMEADSTGSMLDQLNRSVLEVQGDKGEYQRLTDKFAAYWTPSVIVFVVIIVLIGGASTGEWLEWQRRGLVLLVLSCPCAVVMAAPIVTSCTIASAVKRGVLIRGAPAVEATGVVNCVALDKTGTLTSGFFSVNATMLLGDVSNSERVEEEEELLKAAAGLESRSAHPLAHAIVRKFTGDCVAESDKELPEVRDFKVNPGIGLEGWVELDGDWAHVMIGNERILEANGGSAVISPKDQLKFDNFSNIDEGGKSSTLIVAVDDEVRLLISLSDMILPDSPGFIKRLRDQNLDVLVLTGDAQGPADSVCHALRIPSTKCHARLLPADKLQHISDLQNNKPGDPGRRVMMVGDGVNDAGALALASVGVAMGSGGAAMAISAADIVILTKEISVLAKIIALCVRACRLIEQNIAFAVGVKFVSIIVAVTGKMELWAAVVIDVSALVLVVANGTRILSFDVDEGVSADYKPVMEEDVTSIGHFHSRL